MKLTSNNRRSIAEQKAIAELIEGSDVIRRTALQLAPAIVVVAELLTNALRAGGKILICGNGGSGSNASRRVDDQEQAVAKTFIDDILPLFRAGDIACMAPMGVKLGDTEWMCNPQPGNGFEDHGNARIVHSLLCRGSMPPDRPWTPLQLDAYAEWMRGGFTK